MNAWKVYYAPVKLKNGKDLKFCLSVQYEQQLRDT